MSALNEAEYLPESWEAMDAALAKAGDMLEAGTAAPAEVKEAIQALNDAYAGLKARPNTDGLQMLYDELKAELPDLGLYMSEGAAKMQEAFEAARGCPCRPAD